MGIVDRFRGGFVVGDIPQNQNPTIVNAGNSSHDPVRQVTRINGLGARQTVFWHLETTGSALLAVGTVTNASAAETSGNTAVGLVIADSTLSYVTGRAISSSTGGITMALATSTGDGTTARMFLTLPNGKVVAGSTVDFST